MIMNNIALNLSTFIEISVTISDSRNGKANFINLVFGIIKCSHIKSTVLILIIISDKNYDYIIIS